MQSLSRHGIGGSEIAAAVGISRYKSQFALWLEKTGKSPPLSGNVCTRLGQLCEPRARQLYADATGHAVITPPCSIFHERFPWARATPDGVVENDPRHLVQIKCVGYYVGRRWKYDGLPIEIEAQCQWEMLVTGADRNDLCAIVGSDELAWERLILGDEIDPARVFDSATLQITTIHRNEYDISILLDRAQQFWRYVETDTQPPIDSSVECTKWLNRKRPKASVTVSSDDPEIAAYVDEFRVAYKCGSENERRLDLAKNRVRQLLADVGANRIDTPDGPITWIEKSNGSHQLRAPSSWSE